MRNIKPDYRKSLLILESRENALPLMRTFLQNREFIVHSTTNFKDAIQYLLKYKPRFLMVSVDYPNRGVIQLSREISSTTGTQIVLYAEKNVASSIQLLVDSKWDYVLYPPVTGPAVERMVLRIYRDLNKKQAELRMAELESQKRKASTAAETQTTLFKGNGTSVALPQASGAAATAGQHRHMQTSSAPAAAAVATSFDTAKAAASIALASASKATTVATTTATAAAQNTSAAMVTKPEVKVTPTSESSKAYGLDNVISLDAVREERKGSGRSSDKQSHAEDVQDFVCTMVNWNGHFGYLLTQPPGFRVKPTELASIDARIKEVHGANAKSDSFRVLLSATVFQTWVITMRDASGMLYKGRVLKTVFVPAQGREPMLKPSENEGMLQVAVKDVPTDTNLDFNLYLHLKLNRKFVLFVKRGLALSADRKSHLIQNGVEHLHLLRLEADEFNSMHAQRFLTNSLVQFNAAAGTGAA